MIKTSEQQDTPFNQAFWIVQVRRIGRAMVPISNDNTLFSTLKTVSHDFKEE